MKKLSKKYRKLAKKAGFAFWRNEPWGPGKGYIDWGSEYNEEMFKFIKLLEKSFIKKLHRTRDFNSTFDDLD